MRSQVLVQTTTTTTNAKKKKKKKINNYCILEPIGNVISLTAGKVIAWDAAGEAAGEAAKTVVDGN